MHRLLRSSRWLLWFCLLFLAVAEPVSAHAGAHEVFVKESTVAYHLVGGHPRTEAAAPRRFLFSPLFWLLLVAIVSSIVFAIRLPNRRIAVGAAILVAAYFLVLLIWSSRHDH